jgi:site-specific recombinase XerD
MGRITIREGGIQKYAAWLRRGEKSAETIAKYKRCARDFAAFAGKSELTRELTVAYKAEIAGRYTAAGANGMIAAVNSLLTFMGLRELKVSQLRVQRRLFTPPERELKRPEFERLVASAESGGNSRMALVLRTMLATGIRVGELKFITVEAARAGRTEIRLKGKIRGLLLQPRLCSLILRYAKANGVESGAVFVTRSGKPLDRSNVWRGMKALARRAGIPPEKVFPHNLRHLFARIFFSKIPNLAALADVMGHSDVNTTRIYTATSSDELRRQLESLKLVL